MKLNAKQREELRQRFNCRCAYCGIPLPERGWHVDHVEPVNRHWWKNTKWYQATHGKQKPQMDNPERDTWENMMPACFSCNLDKAAQSIEGWRQSLENKVRVCRDNYSAFRHAERFGLVAQVKTKVRFYFETMECESRSDTNVGGGSSARSFRTGDMGSSFIVAVHEESSNSHGSMLIPRR